jgi:hypothetical protein
MARNLEKKELNAYSCNNIQRLWQISIRKWKFVTEESLQAVISVVVTHSPRNVLLPSSDF